MFEHCFVTPEPCNNDHVFVQMDSMGCTRIELRDEIYIHWVDVDLKELQVMSITN
jgi:hypothetical protein